MIEHSSYNKLVGTILGNYRLEQLLERSKVGPLFVARTSNTGTAQNQYLLRILDIPAELTAEARIVYLGRFQQEAIAIAALRHPAILPLLDYGTYQGMPYLVFPHTPTMSLLRAHLTQQGPVDLVTASCYIDQIAAALEYAHQQAVLHRNLTSESIFIENAPDRPAHLLVANFGVMRMLELSRQDGQGFRVYGSNEGMAPEQLLGKPVDTATDTYALGAVLYHMLTGQRLFTGNNYEEVMHKHLYSPVPSLSNQLKNVPPGLDSFMATALAKEPTQRFRRLLAFANAYHQIVAPQDIARPPLAITTPPSALATVPIVAQRSISERRPVQRVAISRRRVLIAIVAGGGTVAVVTAVAIFGSHFLSGTTTTTTAPSATTSNSAATTPVSHTGGATTTTSTQPPSGHTGTVLAHTTDIPVNGSKTFHIANQSNPGIIVHLNTTNFVAFDSTCTHAGCAVNYNAQNKLLECPCHDAAFDPAKNAAVVQGPAQTPLAPIKISVNTDGTITTG